MMSTSIDPHNNDNGRSLRMIPSNRLFPKIRIEQSSESVLPSIIDSTNFFDHHPLDESILNQSPMIPTSPFADYHHNLSSSSSSSSTPTSFSPLHNDHNYGLSINSLSQLPSPDNLTINNPIITTNSSTGNSWPQINCRTLRPDDYHTLLELLSSNTNTDSPPIFFGSALIDPSTPTPYSDATRTQPKKRMRPDHVKRPMNAFMVFSQIERRKMVQLAPHLPNADISKCCGAKWKRMSLRERQPYMEESARLKYLHTRQYPTYKYQPRKRSKTNQSSNITQSHPLRTAVIASSSMSPPALPRPILCQTTVGPKTQPETPPPSLPHLFSSGSNPNDPISLLVATLFDQKLSMFSSSLPQFNIDHFPYHFTPPNPQLYPSSIPFDSVTFLTKQQSQHRFV